MEIIALLVLSLIPSLFWLLFYLRKDYKEPEPRKLLLKIFVLSAVVSFPAAFVAEWLAGLYLGSSPESTGQLLWYIFLSNVVLVGPIEEFVKYWSAKTVVNRNRAQFTQIVDGVIYMAVSASAFAFVENFTYLFGQRSESVSLGLISAAVWGSVVGILVVRSVGATLMHLATSGILGYFWGVSQFTHEDHRAKRFLIGFGAAALIHGLFNFSILATAVTNTEFELLALALAVGATVYVFYRFSGTENVRIHTVSGEPGVPEKPKTTTLVLVALILLLIAAGTLGVQGIGKILGQTEYFYSLVSFRISEEASAPTLVRVVRAETLKQCEIITVNDATYFDELFYDTQGDCDGSPETNDFFGDAFKDLPTKGVYLAATEPRGYEVRFTIEGDLTLRGQRDLLRVLGKELEGYDDLRIITPVNFCETGCWFNGACAPQPDGSSCIEGGKKAWACDAGLIDAGNSCVSCSTASCNASFPGSVYSHFDYSAGKCQCDCPAGYGWNSAGTSCINRSAVCNLRWQNTYWDGTFAPDGKFNCSCKPGYVWNHWNTACVPGY